MLPSVSHHTQPSRSTVAVAATPRAVRGGFRVQAAVRTLIRPRSWSLRWRVFGVLAVLYIALNLLIVIPGSPVLRLDSYLVNLHLWHFHPGWYPWIATVVAFGQRWIMTYVLQLVFLWAAYRARSTRPLVLFVTAILVLNVSVGIVKYALGRVGPILEDNPHVLFHLGASIFPSGHVANTVVLYGVLAWAVPQYRKALAGFTVVISICVGLGTVFMRTHWFSDVMGGWLAGAMVLLAVPSVIPFVQRFADLLEGWVRSALARRPELDDRAHRLCRWGLHHVPAHPASVAEMGAGQQRERARIIRGS